MAETAYAMLLVITSIKQHPVCTNCDHIYLSYIDKNFGYYYNQVFELQYGEITRIYIYIFHKAKFYIMLVTDINIGCRNCTLFVLNISRLCRTNSFNLYMPVYS